MSNTVFHQLYFHVIWSTKDRKPLITEPLAGYVRDLIVEDAKRRGADVIACGVMPDHAHLLVSLGPTIAIATLIGQVKGFVAYEMNKTTGDKVLQWQEGYGVLTLRKNDVGRVARYVDNQPAIHERRAKESVLELTESPI